MPEYVDLEIGLRRRAAKTWSVELRLKHPRSASDEIEEARVRFDLQKLRDLVHNVDAYGRLLADSLFKAPNVQSKFCQVHQQAKLDKFPLRVRLRVGSSASELHEVLWETLRDPKDGTALLMDENIWFSRYLSSRDWRAFDLRPKSKLRALAAIANPSDLAEWSLPPIAVEEELARFASAFEGIPATTLASGGTATLGGVIGQLREGHDILYLACHGYVSQGEPQILLEDTMGRAERVPGVDLVDALGDLQRPPCLVVLASCHSAGPGEDGPNGGREALAALAPRMAAEGVPAVLAMQGRVSMQTLAEFMPVFFSELGRDGQIER